MAFVSSASLASSACFFSASGSALGGAAASGCAAGAAAGGACVGAGGGGGGALSTGGELPAQAEIAPARTNSKVLEVMCMHGCVDRREDGRKRPPRSMPREEPCPSSGAGVG